MDTSPIDVDSYGKANIAFPHETTLDQFFSESQFESYRALGQLTIDQILSPIFEPERRTHVDSDNIGFVGSLFNYLNEVEQSVVG